MLIYYENWAQMMQQRDQVLVALALQGVALALAWTLLDVRLVPDGWAVWIRRLFLVWLPVLLAVTVLGARV